MRVRREIELQPNACKGLSVDPASKDMHVAGTTHKNTSSRFRNRQPSCCKSPTKHIQSFG